MKRLVLRGHGSRLSIGLVAILVAALLVGAASPAGGDGGSVRETVVDAQLLDQLANNPTGGVAATITTWNRDDLGTIQGLVGGTQLRTLPMVLTKTLTLAQLQQLQAMPAVRSVYPNRRYEIEMEDTTWITKARYVWASSSSGGPQAFGVTGKGVELAVIDTGADANHEDMDNLVEFCDTTQALSNTRSTVACTPHRAGTGNLPYGTGTDPRTDCLITGTCDDEGHGSHVSGTVAGTGHASGGTQSTHSTIGMSPHAKLRVYSANVGPALLDHEILASYDDLTFKKENGFNRVVAVNNSWGGGTGYSPSDPQTIAFKRAYAAGILSVFAAGNDGPEHDTLSSQCVTPVVVCVAASTKPDSIAMFSSRGRPSQPTDTNRDGVIDDGDVPPDNHDRRLAQALDIGLHRPTLAAPGVNINSISANALGCREDLDALPDTGCYEQLQGTSMASPHVTGAVGLIVEAYRQRHGGRTPTPAQISDILERSANLAKLPAWDTEEQGAGRLDVHEAVKIAKGVTNPKRPNFGHPTPPYVPGDYPKGPQGDPDFRGCTAAGSWSAQGVDPVVRYGQHYIEVPEKAERLRITVRWNEIANNYLRIWRPGVDPDSDTNPAGPTRTFADNESTGLLGPDGLPFFGPQRLLEIRSPEAGTWTMRVYNRTPDPSSDGCDLAGPTHETPRVLERAPADGHDYDVWVELPGVTHQPSVVIDSPTSATSGRFVEIRGRAGYPDPDNPPVGTTGRPWEGVTSWEVPASNRTNPSQNAEPDPANPRTKLYFHGNLHDAGTGATEETSCPPDGEAATLLAACRGPYLLKSNTLSTNPAGAASWKGDPVEWAFDGTSPGGDRTLFDPHWVWCLVDSVTCPATESPAPGPQTVAGAMTVEWWAQCGPLCVGGGPEWWIRLWADGVLKFEQQVSPGPFLPNVPERLRATVNLPTITANERLTLHVEPVFLFNQFLPFLIYYDHQGPCVPGVTTGACDSLVRMPTGTSGGAPGSGPAPENIRVTDLPASAPYPSSPQSPALRIAWDPQTGVDGYKVYRSTDPTTLGTVRFSGAGTPCTSPEAPGDEPDSQPGHDPAGLCFTDTGAGGPSFLTTYYYRVLSVRGGQTSSISNVGYGAPTRYNRQVKLKVDRLYGPQHWEYALAGSSPTPPDTTNAGLQWRFIWDTLELSAGAHAVFARSFTQGIGSPKAQRTLLNDGDPPPRPCQQGGDDDDDDCEDDDDDEEDEDD